tara:strand:- start:2029 stop:2184 length:156 start_codon:yes stop_codon:yes gene_type:complete
MPAGDLAAVLDFHRWESPTLLIPSDENNLEVIEAIEQRPDFKRVRESYSSV